MNQTIDRILIGLMSLGYLAGSVILVGIAIGWTTPLNALQEYLLRSTNGWLVGITGFILFLVSLTLFVSVFKSQPVKDTIVHETPLGTIKITLPALENLVVKAAKSVQGVRDVKINLKLQQESVSIFLKVQILPDLNIPFITEELQKKVREYLNKTTGIDVHDVKIVVNKISWEAKNRVE